MKPTWGDYVGHGIQLGLMAPFIVLLAPFVLLAWGIGRVAALLGYPPIPEADAPGAWG